MERSFLDLDKQVKDLRTANAKAYDRLRQNNQLYQEKKLAVQQYKDSSEAIRKEITGIDRQRDSLEKLTRDVALLIRSKEKDADRKNNARRTGSGFSGMKFNNDTLNGRWYGLYTSEELQKASDRFDHRVVYNETARNKLFTAGITAKDDYWTIAEEKTGLTETIYLQGGFLVNKETGLPFHLPDGFLIVHKDRVGNEGFVQLVRINPDGKQLWTMNTGLKEFYDWQLKGDKLIITGTDNKNLSPGEINLLQIVNLKDGSVAAYDFFTDKQRPVKKLPE
jgi:hypothetical protein